MQDEAHHWGVVELLVRAIIVRLNPRRRGEYADFRELQWLLEQLLGSEQPLGDDIVEEVLRYRCSLSNPDNIATIARAGCQEVAGHL